MSQETLLICTVGGSPEPVVASIKHWQPGRVLFIPTTQTLAQVADGGVPLAEREGVKLSPGCPDYLELPDGQDFSGTLHKLRELTSEVSSWLARGEQFQVVVDFTGGTKCMT